MLDTIFYILTTLVAVLGIANIFYSIRIKMYERKLKEIEEKLNKKKKEFK